MESHKLRIKVGEHEFEAEGSPKDVTEQFHAWKELIASTPKSASGSDLGVREGKPKLPGNVTEVKTQDGYAAPWDIFDIDDKRKLVTLKIHPTGDDKDEQALLLLLFGYKKSYGQDEVLATKLIASMQVSGLRPGRIDRTLAGFIDAGLVLNSGRGKGSKYRLTNTGYAKADETARELFSKVYVTD